MPLRDLIQPINFISPYEKRGRVVSIMGLMVEVEGLEAWCVVGSRCLLENRFGKMVEAEVVGFRGYIAQVMPFQSTEGIGPGCAVIYEHSKAQLFPCQAWLGRVINALGQPIDQKGVLPLGHKGYSLSHKPPPAHSRKLLTETFEVGVRAIDLFTTCCKGQRMGIFAGSGVGKSVLMSMIARFSKADVIVIGLIGERGREVQEFIQSYLGDEGLARSVLIVATSDEAPLMRKQAAYATLTVAEYFADQGMEVLCMMDSVTRFAMSMREIGLSLGEPPASKGYTPTVFAELPRLLERAGPGTRNRAHITGLFTVLVEGDDHNEPVADAVRGILDGHIVLERQIAERGRFPAMNLLRSVSRTMPDCNAAEHTQAVSEAKQMFSIYEDMVDMIRLGAYKQGTDPSVDIVMEKVPAIFDFLNQGKDEKGDVRVDLANLIQLIGMNHEENLTPANEA
ncbi:MAG: flagellar protein export ATPase FliI [Alphaproteobacteria bacterium]|mgnify:CR=1 FL=1|nr:flagellar protein export ATPase FliI [Alphaproteobacteria bacterium]OJV46955.1 MAG: flagellum-specific ATP synthase FliI [Alphaproteobacteria bacterium 43-37]